ncbi:hypothetical protein L2E82_08571 [Cichorium intybus]|uniref:Uncharacterized protein n=1 Tax=Cichorium intybus TaxID=13427 RepID=A0ACB9G6P2_CICIN|nr:hypothetical protein L2E82_08571 [Cichorium intybus]
MALDRPFLINLYWGGNIEYVNGIVKGDQSTLTTSNIVRHKMSYEEFKDLIYAHVGIDKIAYKLSISLCYQFGGICNISRVINDSSLELMYYLAENDQNYYGQVLVEIEKISHEQTRVTGFVDLLRNFDVSEQTQSQVTNPSNVAFPLPNNDRFEAADDFGFDDPNSQCSEDNVSKSVSDVGDDSDDLNETPVVNFMNDIGDEGDDDITDLPDTIHMDVWNESENKIRLGMQFESREDVKKAVTLWSIAQNREFKVYESKSRLWVAKCKTLGREEESSNIAFNTPHYTWYVRAVKKKNHHMWKITRWVGTHNCFGSCIGNNNRNLNSEIIASYVIHSIKKDVAYPVKQIQADIKNSLNVNVSYGKAWHGRRRAIENIYGTWESNFAELPKYIAALQASNPSTIVKWFHETNNSSSHVATFKYIFWAFGPAIDAFQLCRPVISVDGCHLKGSYKGKMLVAVTKDANNSILPIAYAIVDEETSHSWCWFLYQFRHYVAQDRQLCVISDRHQGIIHAMTNLEEWKEPLAYHRFCLRHIRSNLMKKYNNMSLKRFCWAMGSTTQKRKFVKYIKEIKSINPEAWQYLRQIHKSQWCLLYDANHRWGFLTTNISESMNNALRGARQLPIRACIDLTFNRTVQLFRKHSANAMNCNTPLPSRMWRLFHKRETRAQSHSLTEFDYNEGVYRIVTKFQINEKGGNTQTVHYFQHTCTCGKWQMERLPCSHALAVCRYRGDNPLSIVNTVYTTVTYKQQYNYAFAPLSHVDYWLESDWKIEADYSKLSVSRGRRRSNRFRNEMDVRHPDEPRRCGLCHQPGHNRRNCSNSQPRYNAT